MGSAWGRRATPALVSPLSAHNRLLRGFQELLNLKSLPHGDELGSLPLHGSGIPAEVMR